MKKEVGKWYFLPVLRNKVDIFSGRGMRSQVHRLGAVSEQLWGGEGVTNTCLDFRDSQRQGNQEKVIEKRKLYLPDCLFQNQATVISFRGDCGISWLNPPLGPSSIQEDSFNLICIDPFSGLPLPRG